MTTPKALPLHPTFKGRQGPVLLVIMDGIGNGKQDDSDAVFLAKTPTLDRLKTSPLYREIKTHGPAVGLPTNDDMGNSEVGHNTLGAGRIFPKGALLVNDALNDGSVFSGDTWQRLIQNCKEKNTSLHLIGLLSDGNVHGHINHTLLLIKEAHKQGVQTCRLHILLDGRDVEGKSALRYLDTLENTLSAINAAGADYQVASGGGRMLITMDRYEAEWDMVERGWQTHVLGEGVGFSCAKEAIETAYAEDPELIDQYIPPFVIHKDGQAVGAIEDNDSVIFTNFRGDRAMELSIAFEEKNFNKFNRKRLPQVLYAGMVQYDGDLQIPSNFLVPFPKVKNPIGEYLCASGISSFAISETQKYGHVTYFWNGNRSDYINKELETYIEIPSEAIPFHAQPAMKAEEITKKTIALLNSGNYQFGRLNFPNGDMVGHTTNKEAIIKSCEVVDNCLAKLIETIDALDGTAIILADHGNADELYQIKKGKKILSPAHSLNPVPFVIVDKNYQKEYQLSTNLPDAGLANVASTLCHLLGLEPPADYEPSLIDFK